MSEKTLKTRIQNKRGTSTEWAAATNFTPFAGELCFYSDLNKIKIGDGTKKISELSFVEPTNMVTTDTAQMITGLKIFQDTGSGSFGLEKSGSAYNTYIHPTSSTLTRNVDIRFPNLDGTVMLLEGDQSVIGHKTFEAGFTTTAIANFNADAAFNSELDLNCPVMTNNSVGTAGQVLTSQGAGKTPIWGTPSKIYEHNVRLACKSSAYYVYVFLRLYHTQATALTVSEVLSLLKTQTREASGFGMANVENLGTYKSVVVTGVSASSNWLYIDICSQNPYTTTAVFGNYSLDYASSSITISDTHIRQVN